MKCIRQVSLGDEENPRLKRAGEQKQKYRKYRYVVCDQADIQSSTWHDNAGEQKRFSRQDSPTL